ncbi:hypothetical protein [Rhizobium sp. CSW-27]|uniref:hypothetical protein n=1 Tax=Rhizobium sp. CSW-27 TaxID=2839985 RepID=UPI001C02DC19|nr:hypothetical protein [Rhizobium sp. CSW-27]MBT9373203.1 hypothetical protein [Rhizobium sp. CSW-27]
MEAFDALPAVVRMAIAFSNFPFDARVAARFLRRGHSAPHVAALIVSADYRLTKEKPLMNSYPRRLSKSSAVMDAHPTAASDNLRAWIERGEREVFSVVVDMTPDLAARLLSTNEDNRPLRIEGPKRSVRAYADAMRRGEWLLNGEAIIVSRGGVLNDGQHRLNAVIGSAATVPMVLTFGVDRDSRHTVDQGAARTPGNILSMYGEKRTNALATAISFVWLYDGQRVAGNYPSPEEMMDTLDSNPAIRDALSATDKLARQFQLSKGYIAGAAYVCGRTRQNVLDSFLHALTTGIGLDSDRDPVFVLRKRFMNHLAQTRRGNRMVALEQAAVFIKAFNAFRTGRGASVLRWPHFEGEAFPRLD